MNHKRAHAAEVREKKIADYRDQILDLIKRFQEDPMGVDYSEELEEMVNMHPVDKGLILIAEREAYNKLRAGGR